MRNESAVAAAAMADAKREMKKAKLIMKKACHSAIDGPCFAIALRDGKSASGGNNSALRSPGRSAPAEPGTPHSAFPRAFTLIELIVVIVILGIVVFALVMGIHQSLRSVGLQRDLRSAGLLIEDLMNEIRSKQYVPSPPSGGTNNRVDFNDVDDYAGWSETPPATIEGVILSNYNGFTRRVFVANVSNDFISPAPTDSDFKRITVVVSNAEMAVSNVSVVCRYD